ncbi:hypothetical protein JX265_000179 [Neoarthrinium moseri]|uniref:Tyrosine-protein phosphatase domain-containing protein n=1 Tax=Neoarthrinium moseri TaxID=1658444 RepID=A0A9Q0AS06_9PEZI|nr:hypothetical protein JX265_000179 [Neoarthrinium moseri]
MMDTDRELQPGVMPAAPYAARPPSPPAIMIPAPNFLKGNQPIVCTPSYANVDPFFLSATDLQIITRNRPQEAHDSVSDWAYEDRRTAQPILDFLYLGPSSVARDRQFLQDHGITMLLAARDSRLAQARIMGVDRVAKELGIRAEYVDVENNQGLIRSFPDTVRKINNHMLDVYRSQAVQTYDGDHRMQDGEIAINPNPEQFRRGRVLIFCETGNDRSAGVVIAYLMSVYGMDMIQACQFIQYRRFCVGLDEDLKYLLMTYEGILNAQKAVHRQQLLNPPTTGSPAATQSAGLGSASPHTAKTKRGIEDTMDTDDQDDMGGIENGYALDRDRYTDRPAFVPFVDVPDRTKT